MKERGVTGRQLSAAVFAGGLAPASAAAAYGWQGPALAVLALLLGGLGLLRLGAGWERLAGSKAGKVLRGAGFLWGVLLMSRWLDRCTRRMELTGGGAEGTRVWIGLLLLPLLLWMAGKGAEAFFRSAELLCPVMVILLAGILVWGGCRGTWRYAALPAPSVELGFWAGVESAAGVLFILPYLYGSGEERAGKRGLLIAGSGGLAAAAGGGMAAVTAAVLSPGVILRTEEPFFAMAACLGSTARVEGLVSSLWLVADLIWIGLLARSGGGRFLPGIAVVLGTAVWLSGAGDLFSPAFWGVGTAVLWLAEGWLLFRKGKNSGRNGRGETTSCGQSES